MSTGQYTIDPSRYTHDEKQKQGVHTCEKSAINMGTVGRHNSIEPSMESLLRAGHNKKQNHANPRGNLPNRIRMSVRKNRLRKTPNRSKCADRRNAMAKYRRFPIEMLVSTLETTPAVLFTQDTEESERSKEPRATAEATP